MNADEYHAMPAISHGKLEDAIANPELYFARHIERSIPMEASPEMNIGSGLHLMVLEGTDAFEARTAIWKGGVTKRGTPTTSKNSNDYRDFLADAEANKLLVLDADDVATIIAMHNALYNNRDARTLLFDWEGPTEHTLTWKRDEWDCKARLDKFVPDRHLPIDLKSTNAMDYAGVVRQAAKLGYHRKAAWYREGVMASTGRAPDDFVFVSVRNEPPHTVWTWAFDTEAALLGEIEINHAFNDVISRMASGIWYPRESSGVQYASVPRYLFTQAALDELERMKENYT